MVRIDTKLCGGRYVERSKYLELMKLLMFTKDEVRKLADELTDRNLMNALDWIADLTTDDVPDIYGDPTSVVVK